MNRRDFDILCAFTCFKLTDFELETLYYKIEVELRERDVLQLAKQELSFEDTLKKIASTIEKHKNE